MPNKTTTHLPMTKEHIRLMLVFQAWFDIVKLVLSANPTVSSSLNGMRNFFNEYAHLMPLTHTRIDSMPISGASSSTGPTFFSASSSSGPLSLASSSSASSSSDPYPASASSSSGPSSAALSQDAAPSRVLKSIPYLPYQVMDFLKALCSYLDTLVRGQSTGDASSESMNDKSIAIFKAFYEGLNPLIDSSSSIEALLPPEAITSVTNLMLETIASFRTMLLPVPHGDSPFSPDPTSTQTQIINISTKMGAELQRLNGYATDFIASLDRLRSNEFGFSGSIKGPGYQNKLWGYYALAFLLESVDTLKIEYDRWGVNKASEISLTSLESIRLLADVLRGNTTITQLMLAYYGINAEATRYLADMLQVNTTIVSLSLRENEIGVEGAKYLANALKDNTTLTSLDLFLCDIGDEGAKYLADMLRVNTTLTSLNLACCNISDVGLAHLAEALQHNKTLISVNIEGINISAAGLKTIADILEHHGTLTSLKVDLEECDEDTLSRITQYLDRNQRNQTQKRESLVSTLFTRTDANGSTVSSGASPVPEVPSLSS